MTENGEKNARYLILFDQRYSNNSKSSHCRSQKRDCLVNPVVDQIIPIVSYIPFVHIFAQKVGLRKYLHFTRLVFRCLLMKF